MQLQSFIYLECNINIIQYWFVLLNYVKQDCTLWIKYEPTHEIRIDKYNEEEIKLYKYICTVKNKKKCIRFVFLTRFSYFLY